MTRHSQQQGFSLIELMIAVTLSMVLMGAALQFISSSRSTYELGDDLSRVQENGRIALDIMVKDLQLASYRRPPQPPTNPFLRPCNLDINGNPSPCTADGDVGLEAPIAGVQGDRLAVQYAPDLQPDGSAATDCLGNNIPADIKLINVYTVRDLDGDGIFSLYCESYDATNFTPLFAPQPLIDGIDEMQVLYGISGPTGLGIKDGIPQEVIPPSVTKYISADQLTAIDWANMRAVRVALLVSNGRADGFADQRLRTYRLLDSPLLPFTDGQARRIYSTTVQFNNQ